MDREKCVEMIKEDIDKLVDEILMGVGHDIYVCQNDEEDQFYERSEAWQDSERGQLSEYAIDYLEEANDKITEALFYLKRI